MQLIADVFVDGHHNHTIPNVKSIRDQLAIEKAWGLVIHQTLRTRYHSDSRFHVYMHDAQDASAHTTMIFRFTNEPICPHVESITDPGYCGLCKADLNAA